MDQLGGAEGLRNSYWVMRHGQSKANVGGVIVSSIDADRRGDFGLSEAGREQVLAAARASGLTAGTLICSSDFARARQTAQLMGDCLGTDEVVSAPALRERYFGDFDGGPVTGYARIWAADEAASPQAGSPDAGSPQAGGPDAGGSADSGVETAAAVLDRAAGLVAGLERGYSGRDILLVSHGDTLQILQAGFAGIDPSRHRTVPHLEVAEIRRLHLAPRPVTPP
jgi:broad specificity phosphatase PhoE